MGWKREVEELAEIGQTRAEIFPVLFPRFDEGGQFFQLLTANGGLRIERL
jgi:hypothetical protein